MRLPALLMTAVLLGAGLAPAHGTTLLRFSLEDLATNAERAFLGRCTAAETVLIDEQIYTRIRFQVDEMLKGEAAAHITVDLPGGRYGDRRVHLAGMPAFVPDEPVVLFLTGPDRLGNPWPVGLGQGKFTVRPLAGQPHVYQHIQGVDWQAPKGAAKTATPTTAYHGMPLEQFLDQVRTLIDAQPNEAPHAR
ncbi:MAG: hypothetical protein GKR89_11885 [Candidatus Latescibacteria bacterium]|nr:hypothetical protein [Candidatus Latescibacterota bacterium]